MEVMAAVGPGVTRLGGRHILKPQGLASLLTALAIWVPVCVGGGSYLRHHLAILPRDNPAHTRIWTQVRTSA